MPNFRVPQFIEVEDKIVGPLSFKQFIYLLGGAGGIFLLYKVLPLYLAGVPIIAIATFALALAFYKVNNRPFVAILEAGVKYYISGRLYVWHRTDKPIKNTVADEKKKAAANVFKTPTLSESKLRDLAWSLDIHQNLDQ
jgi:hypothetical protein